MMEAPFTPKPHCIFYAVRFWGEGPNKTPDKLKFSFPKPH